MDHDSPGFVTSIAIGDIDPAHQQDVPQLTINQHSHVRLVTARTPERVYYLSFDRSELGVEEDAARLFDQEFRPFYYKPGFRVAAERWLTSSRFTTISSAARAELEALAKKQQTPLAAEVAARVAAARAKLAPVKKGKKGKKNEPPPEPPVVRIARDLDALRQNQTKPETRGRKPGSGVFIRNLLMNGKHTPEQIIALVHKQFNGSKATIKDVAWNRNYLKKEGKIVPEVKS